MNQQENKTNLSKATIQGTAWQYITFFSGKLMVLVSTAILARLLSQDDFGVVGYALTAISFVDVISSLGIGSALIYFPEDQKTSSTGFWLNLMIGGGVFVITWLIAPLVGVYFRDARVVPILQVLGLIYPIRTLGDTQDALLNKRLDFKKAFIPELFYSLTKGLASIIFAWLGFGAWSLIWGYLGGTLIWSLIFWFITPWHPSFSLDWKISKSLIQYGFKLIGVDIVAIFLSNLDYLLVGRYLGADSLGIYSIAFRLPDLLILQFARTLSFVIFPIYTRIRKESGRLKYGFFLTTRYLSLVTVPLGLGLFLIAKPVTLAIFSEKWEAAIPVLQSLALYSLFLSLGYQAGSIYKAEGRPQILTWLGLARLIMLFPALWWAVTISKSINNVGVMQAIVALIGTALNLFIATRLIGLSVLELLDSFRPSFVAGAIMAVGVQISLYSSRFFNPWWQMSIGILIGGVIYLLVLILIEKDLMITSFEKVRNALFHKQEN